MDLVIDRGVSREFIEIKNSATFRPDLLKGLRSLKAKEDKGVLLYRGKGIRYDEDLDVVNFSEYLLSPRRETTVMLRRVRLSIETESHPKTGSFFFSSARNRE